MLGRRRKAGSTTPQSKQLVMSSSMSSLPTSSGHASPSSPAPPRLRHSVGGTSAGGGANTSFPSSFADEGRRTKSHQRPTQKNNPHRRPQPRERKPKTASRGGPKPCAPATVRTPAPAVAPVKTEKAAAAVVASTSAPTSSRSSIKAVNTMKPRAQRRRRRQRKVDQPKQQQQQPKTKSQAAPSPVAAPTAVESPEASTPLMSPIAAATPGDAFPDASPSPPQWKEIPRFPPHPAVESLMSSRYEDAGRTLKIATGSRSDRPRGTSAATKTVVSAAAALASTKSLSFMGSPGVLTHRFPSRPDFAMERARSVIMAPTALVESMSGSDLAASQWRTPSTVGPAVASALVSEHPPPATAGISFPVVQSPMMQSGVRVSQSADTISASPAAAIELASFPMLQSPLVVETAQDSGELSAEDRQLSAVGLRVGAPAFQPRPSVHTSPAGNSLTSPSSLFVSSLGPSASPLAGRASAPSRNVIKVVNTATGVMQAHTPSSSDFPRTPAAAAAAAGSSATTAPALPSAELESPDGDVTAASAAMTTATSSQSHRDPSLSTSSHTADERSFSSPRDFPSMPRVPSSRSGSRQQSPAFSPVATRDVRHQNVRITGECLGEEDIISQLFDGHEHDDEDEDELQESWEVGSASSSVHGARQTHGEAYWHLEHGNTANGNNQTGEPATTWSSTPVASPHSAGTGFWPMEDYDASVADPDEYEDIWEVNSSAYEDSLDDAQVQWIEEQMRANENPEGFFF